MPTFPPVLNLPRVTTRRAQVNLLAAGGDETNVTLDGLDVAVTGLQLSDWRDSVGACSNAQVVGEAQTTTVTVNKASALIAPLDESWSSASMKAVLEFQDDTLVIRSIAVPAPDESVFESDGLTVDPADTNIAALITDTLSILNTGTPAGTFAYLRGFRSDRTRRLPRPRVSKSSIEPAAGVNPPDAPGT